MAPVVVVPTAAVPAATDDPAATTVGAATASTPSGGKNKSLCAGGKPPGKGRQMIHQTHPPDAPIACCRTNARRCDHTENGMKYLRRWSACELVQSKVVLVAVRLRLHNKIKN